MTRKQIVSPILFVQMGAFIAKMKRSLVPDNPSVKPSFKRSFQICPQLCQIQLRIPIYDIDFSVVIEKQRAVMIKPLYIFHSPRSGRIPCRHEICFVRIVRRKAEIKNTLVIPKGRRPHSLPVNMLSALQPVPGSVLQRPVRMGYKLPVHKIIRAQNIAARHKVHRRACHIIGVFNPDDIRIRKIRI